MSIRSLILLTLTLLLLAGCQPPPRVSPAGVWHTVKSGQTLYRISKTYGLKESYLARINGVSDPTTLAVGKRLLIPGATKLLKVPATVPSKAPKRVASTSPAASKTKRSSKPQARSKQKLSTRASAPKRSTAKAPTAIKGQFIWPLRGKVVRNFCTTGKNPCKGLEIAVAAKTPVLASSAGKVIYSGNGIRGYGNLIIIMHDNDFYSVYGFNSRNLAESGSFVSQGQKIALSGTPPGSGDPKLHFEIRHGKKSVNPRKYLP